MNADLELLRRMAGAQTSPAVAIDQRPEAVRLPADNRDHQRQPESGGENDSRGGIEELTSMVFPDAEHIEAHLVSEGDCFEQFAEMSRGVDCPPARVNGRRYETIQANLHQWAPMLFSSAASSVHFPTR